MASKKTTKTTPKVKVIDNTTEKQVTVDEDAINVKVETAPEADVDINNYPEIVPEKEEVKKDDEVVEGDKNVIKHKEVTIKTKLKVYFSPSRLLNTLDNKRERTVYDIVLSMLTTQDVSYGLNYKSQSKQYVDGIKVLLSSDNFKIKGRSLKKDDIDNIIDRLKSSTNQIGSL